MHNIASTLGISQCLEPQILQSEALDSGEIEDTLDAGHRIDLKIEHADDDGNGNPESFAACTDDDVIDYAGLSSGIFAVLDSSDDAQRRIVVEYKGGKRFVKVTATPVSLADGGPVAMLALKGNLSSLPADNS